MMLGPVRDDIRQSLRVAWLDPGLEAAAEDPVFFAAAWSAIRPSVGRSFLALVRTLRERATASARALGAPDLAAGLMSVLTPEEVARVGDAARAGHLAAAKTQIVLHLFLRAARRERTSGTGSEEPPSRRGIPEWQRWMTVQPIPDRSREAFVRANERFGTVGEPGALRPFARWPESVEALWDALDPLVGGADWRQAEKALRRSLHAGLEVLPHPVALQWAVLHEQGFDEDARRRMIDTLEAHDGPAAGQTIAAAFAWVAFGRSELGADS
jgi:hypothetical protein